jgi:diacylglycerol kinase family enzyme
MSWVLPFEIVSADRLQPDRQSYGRLPEKVSAQLMTPDELSDARPVVCAESPLGSPFSVRETMPQRRYHIVFNPNSGTALSLGLTADALCERFTAAGLDASIDADGETPLGERIVQALANEAEIIVAAGGDGTVTALAEAMVDTDKTLALLPLGTANLLARDLSIPLELDAAIAAMAAMEPKRIDLGEVNKRIFLHNVSIGFVTSIAAARERIRGHNDIGSLLGFARYFFQRIARARRIAVEIDTGNGAPRTGRVHAVVIANNSYDQGLGQVFSRQSLSDGHLSLYTLRHFALADFFRLTTSMVLGRWQQEEAIDIEDVTEVTIRTKKPTIVAMLDGELETLDIPLQFSIRPLALSVLAPVAAEAADAGADQPEFAVGI